MTPPMVPTAPELTALLLDTRSLEQFLHALALKASASTPASDGCGVTVKRQNRPLTVASAGSSATRLDEKQYGQDDGPCLQAMRTGREVAVTDMSSERRWGGYPAYASTQGTRSSLSLPISAHTHTAGAMNMYSSRANGFAHADLGYLRSLAAQATGAIALAQRMSDAQEFSADLQAALSSRTVIDQATGVIMSQQRCTADEAFAILRSASQNRNIKLRSLCVELLTEVGGGSPETQELRPRD